MDCSCSSAYSEQNSFAEFDPVQAVFFQVCEMTSLTKVPALLSLRRGLHPSEK